MERHHDDRHTPNPAFDTMDPHGATHADHGHHIISARTLMAILLALLFFTILTVFLSRAEVWVQNTFSVVLPQWVNVLGAMSIAVVKGTLVVAFFMGLRYDKPLNLFVLLFCLAAVAQFIIPATLDLYTRDWVTAEHKGEIIKGGTGEGLAKTGEGHMFVRASPRPNTGSEPLFEFRREQRLEELAHEVAAKHGRAEANDEDKAEAAREFWFEHYDEELHEKGHAIRHLDDLEDFYAQWRKGHVTMAAETTDTVAPESLEETTASTANHSLRRVGRTLGLFDAQAPSPSAEEHATPERAVPLSPTEGEDH
ncbi:MAG: cytochrome C oxidase subunit IV family protein [Phycisphaerales bacterium]